MSERNLGSYVENLWYGYAPFPMEGDDLYVERSYGFPIPQELTPEEEARHILTAEEVMDQQEFREMDKAQLPAWPGDERLELS